MTRVLWRAAWLLASLATLRVAASPAVDPAFVREAGRCALRGECGSKGALGGQIPCPDNGLAVKSDDPVFLATLSSLCGSDFPDTTCCTQDQLNTLSSSIQQAEPLIASCPACRNNFVAYYCHFTCSPNQSQFVTVTETQELKNNQVGVKTVDVAVAEHFGEGFFDSCKDVKFGATNGFAMEYIHLASLVILADPYSSGCSINYPDLDPPPSPLPPTDNTTIVPLNFSSLSCAAPGLNSRCACPDCPAVCATLPPIPTPADRAHRCHVGRMDCLPFAMTIIWASLVIAFATTMTGISVWKLSKTKPVGKWATWPTLPTLSTSSRPGYDRVPLNDPLSSFDSGADNLTESPRSGSLARGPSTSTTGAASTSDAQDGDSLAGRQKPPSGAPSLGRSSSHDTSISTPSPSPFLQPRTYTLNTVLASFFYRLGYFCAKRPYLTLALGLAVAGGINSGWSKFEVERDPVRLWVAKGSESARAKEQFDNAFGPFYRTEQIFVSVAPAVQRLDSAPEPGMLPGVDVEYEAKRWEPADEPVLTWSRLQWLASVQSTIRALESPSGYSLKDVCFSPQTNPDAPEDTSSCVVQSVMGWLGDTLDEVDENSWQRTLNECAASPSRCLPPYGQPLAPKFVVGGLEGQDGRRFSVSEARGLVVTYVVRNSLDSELIAKVEEWETTLQKYLSDLSSPSSSARLDLDLQISYSTGISLETELNKSANTDIPIVVVSYVLMFLYIAINLGGSGAGLLKSAGRGLLLLGSGIVHLIRLVPFPSRLSLGRQRSASVTLSLAGSTSGMGAYFRRQVLVDSKFLLGLWGISIVLLSVSTSVALFSALGVKVTLVIAEVIPFLVLAIGVDNIFILSHELDQQNARAYATSARVGGAIFSTHNEEEDDAFGLPPAEERVAAALSRMGPSILLTAISETVAFSLGALVGMPAVRNFAIYAAGAVVLDTILQVTVFVSAMAIDLQRIEANRVDCMPCLKLPQSAFFDLGATVTEGFIARFIRTVYAPVLLKKPVKYLVMVLFSGLFLLSWIGSRHITLGLDQRLALPSNSYLVNYFNAVDTFLDVGPPVYFVMKDVNVSARANQQRVCGRFSTCQELSLANVLEAERKRSDASFIAEPPAVWMDDFFQYLNPLLEDCCRVSRADPSVFCSPDDPDVACRPCFEDADPPYDTTMNGFPEGDEFHRYLVHWAQSPTDETCPLGGKAGYSTALKLNPERKTVDLSHFRTFHTPLKTQDDFINAMASAHRVARDLSRRTGGTVFPYSLFYVFFDQYSHIVATTRQVLTFAFLSIFAITSLFLGSWRTGAVVVTTVFLSVVSVMGGMGAWGVSLNAISLVNLVISIGLSLEFCLHIARSFMAASGGGLSFNHPAGMKDRDERARIALNDVGSSVVSGITMTKLIGVSVLALTRSRLLETYFFRVWLILIVSAALHGLVFLPVALSFFGGQGFSTGEDEDWLGNVIGSRYEHEGRPFLGDSDDESEDDGLF
ncbi:vacuolar membrane protein [Pseudohyphozyma bogoriensis]|nr:vacuolar membrane protein [Pseudohyphozyma bogoriensis]